MTKQISEDMKGMFEKPLRLTYELITQQWQNLKKSKKVKPKVRSNLTLSIKLQCEESLRCHARLSSY
jgi:hypothetical protein